MATDVPTEVAVLAAKYGIPSAFIAFLWWLTPKIWSTISSKLAVAQQQNGLVQAGLGGVTDVITTMRGQISDLTKQFEDVEQKLKDMTATLDDAVKAKLVAEQEAAKAKSDLYSMRLWVERLQAQVRSLGAVPVGETP